MSNKMLMLSAIFSITAAVAQAEPMNPASKAAPGTFSARILSAFTLFADSDDPALVYYIPLRGGLAVQSPASPRPIPRLSVTSRTLNDGLFFGDEISYLGGSFSTVGDAGALAQLQTEATKQGLKLQPAPVTEAKTTFMTTGRILENGRIDLVCEKKPFSFTKDGQTVNTTTTECKTRGSTDEPYARSIELMYRFNSLPVTSSNIVSDVPFQAVLFDSGTNIVRNLLNSGQSWDSFLTSKVDWKLKTQRKTRKAVIEIQWDQLFEQAEAFASYHNYSCVDVELKAFYDKLATCNDASKCGVKVLYQKDGSTELTPIPPNDADFIQVVNVIKDQVQNELFAQVAAAGTSQLGRVNQSKNAQFVLRANYERRVFKRKDSREILWNPGATVDAASTFMNVSCVKGGFSFPIEWDMENPGCKSLLGQ